ncbi:MAG: TIM barrel protein, partial [Geodermatophilaceae bacterium]
VYHLAVNGDEVDAVIERYADRIAHVQVADNPSRGEPGSRKLPLTRWLEKLTGQGYAGWVGLEYKPTGGDTEQSLQWLPPAQRAA